VTRRPGKFLSPPGSTRLQATTSRPRFWCAQPAEDVRFVQITGSSPGAIVCHLAPGAQVTRRQRTASSGSAPGDIFLPPTAARHRERRRPRARRIGLDRPLESTREDPALRPPPHKGAYISRIS